MTKSIGAGLKHLLYYQIDNAGIMTGGASAPSAGADGSPAELMLGAQQFPARTSQGELVVVDGDDEDMTQFLFDSGGLPSGVIEMATFDRDFQALCDNVVNESLGDLTLSLQGARVSDRPQLGLIIQRRAKKWAKANRGSKAWEALFIPNATAQFLGSDYQSRTANPYGYFYSGGGISTYPWGKAFTKVDNGSGTAPIFHVFADSPIMVERWTLAAANSVTTFNFSFTPAAADKVHVFVNGTLQTTGLTVDPSTSDMTFDLAPSEGYMVAIYELAAGELDDQ